MSDRNAPSASTTSRLGLSRLRLVPVGRRQARRPESELARALAGEFGPGVQADVVAAQYRSATQQATAA